jgi:hypothetical protein
LQEHSNAQEMIGKMLFGSIIRRQKESEWTCDASWFGSEMI